MKLLDSCRDLVRAMMRRLAASLNRITNGRLSPNAVTVIGLFAHLPIALLIAGQYYWWAAGLLVVFGLFDTLDGELARLQGKVSATGMLLDSVTDRVKEVLLYSGVAYAIVATGRPYMAVWAVVAVGASLLVSYVNAWAEVVSAHAEHHSHQLNKAFRSGLMSFEVRMAFLVLGLLSGRLILATMAIAVLATLTAVTRLVGVFKILRHV